MLPVKRPEASGMALLGCGRIARAGKFPFGKGQVLARCSDVKAALHGSQVFKALGKLREVGENLVR